MAKHHRRRRHYGDTVSVKLAGIGIPHTVTGKGVLIGAAVGVAGVALAKKIVAALPAGITSSLPTFVSEALTGPAVPLLGGITGAVVLHFAGKSMKWHDTGGLVTGAVAGGLGASALMYLAQGTSTAPYFSDTVAVKLAGYQGVIVDDQGGPRRAMNGVIVDDNGGPQPQRRMNGFRGYSDNPALEGVMMHAFRDAEDDDVP